MALNRAILIEYRGGDVVGSEGGDYPELLKKARGYSQTSLPSGVDSVEVWKRPPTLDTYREDGSRCPKRVAPAKKAAAKKATGTKI